MSAKDLEAFCNAVDNDVTLQKKLNASIEGQVDTPSEIAAAINIAQHAGFTITAGDLLKAKAQAVLDLNDDDLEQVAGGVLGLNRPGGPLWGSIDVMKPHKTCLSFAWGARC